VERFEGAAYWLLAFVEVHVAWRLAPLHALLLYVGHSRVTTCSPTGVLVETSHTLTVRTQPLSKQAAVGMQGSERR